VVVGSSPSQPKYMYSKYSTALLQNTKPNSDIKPLKGMKITLKGRLNGITRTRKNVILHKGVSPNTIASNIKEHQLPINTK